MSKAPISHALSTGAREYLQSVFNCTTRENLLALGDDVDPKIGGLNVFDENLQHHQEGNDRFIYDEEISAYIVAVREGREPYDPAEHDFDIQPSDEIEGWTVSFCGVATGGEWESVVYEFEDEQYKERNEQDNK